MEAAKRVLTGQPALVPLECEPDPNCRKCHGKGSLKMGRGFYTPCKCTFKS